jgi:diphthamide biosynthesis protein 4
MANSCLDGLTDYYSLLHITRSASPNTIKTAYRRALLHLHPDKQRADDDPAQSADIGLLHDAFVTLSSSALRTAYDAQDKLSRTSPRPAQAVSLDLFDCSEGSDGAISTWTLACRCGGRYEITECDLERGLHLVGCEDCSEIIWVGYEVVQEVDEKAASQQESK